MMRMAIRQRIVLLAALGAFPAGLWAQAVSKPSPYRITGTVVSSTDGSPVRHCHLTANLANAGASGQGAPGTARVGAGTFRRGGGSPGRSSPSPNNAVDADDNGHFTITLPSPGAWTLTAAARGYTSGAYEQHRQYSSAVVLTPEAPAYDLVFRMAPEASITGIVLDEAGEPVRNAQVALHIVPAPSPDGSGSHGAGMRDLTQTDDRGIYEFANLVPEQTFRISVQARPWYAASAQPGRGNMNANVTDSASALDPSLDVTYPLLWFPGVDDPTEAETITVHAGEAYQADFHLSPIPSIHLRIITPVNVDASGRAVPLFPVFERVIPGGGGGLGAMSMVNVALQNGQTEVSGLSPGTYRIHLQGQNGSEPRTAQVEITPGSVRTLDLSAVSSTTANVAVLLDGISDEGTGENWIQVVLTDPGTGQQFFPPNGAINGFGGGGPGNQRRRGGGPSMDHPARGRGRVIEVPPGRYEVTLYSSERSNTYLTAITAKGADVDGRFVTVSAGDSTLTLHLASGLATLTGNVTMRDEPVVGATVLLVPASLGDPGCFATIGQDQSNTDGSFDITGITPGQYILIAIDHGWQINWSDSATLRRYLTQGIPVDLSSAERLKQKIEAQSP
jgi:hypothetical protein